MGGDILELVEESRITGKFYEVMNTTYIVLIPKIQRPTTFNNFRPIPLCNLVYKVISRIFARRIKSMLTRCISSEHFVFLENHHIHDVVGVAQEVLPNIKQSGKNAMVLI